MKYREGMSLLWILFIIFLVLKLTKLITWSWWWVFSPLWISALLFIAAIIIAALIGKSIIKKFKLFSRRRRK